jgi:hypothetical protein
MLHAGSAAPISGGMSLVSNLIDEPLNLVQNLSFVLLLGDARSGR